MRNSRHHVNRILIMLSLMLIAGCSDPTVPEGGNDDIEPEIVDNVYIVNPDSLTLVSIEDGLCEYCVQSGVEPDIEVGDIIVGELGIEAGGGYLRTVTDVAVQGNTVTVETGSAVLVDAVVNGQVADVFALPLEPVESKAAGRRYLGSRINYLAPGAVLHPGVIELDGVELFDNDIGSVHLSVFFEDGYIAMDPMLDIGFTIRNAALEEFHAMIISDLELQCDLQVTLSAGLEKPREFGPMSLFSCSHLFVQFIGTFPVFELVTFEVSAGCSLDVQAEMGITYGVKSSASNIRIGARYDVNDSPCYSPVWDLDSKDSETQCAWFGSADLKIKGYVQAKASAYFYTILGPYITLDPYLQLHAFTDLHTWCFDPSFGYGLDVGVEVRTLDDNVPLWNKTLNKDEVPLPRHCFAEDAVPPAAVTDLTAREVSEGTVLITWTAPGDDGLDGRAAMSDLRYSKLPINAESWESCVPVNNVPMPPPPGRETSAVIGGLEPGELYYCAVKTGDEVPNWSAPSNVDTVLISGSHEDMEWAITWNISGAQTTHYSCTGTNCDCPARERLRCLNLNSALALPPMMIHVEEDSIFGAMNVYGQLNYYDLEEGRVELAGTISEGIVDCIVTLTGTVSFDHPFEAFFIGDLEITFTVTGATMAETGITGPFIYTTSIVSRSGYCVEIDYSEEGDGTVDVDMSYDPQNAMPSALSISRISYQWGD